MTYLQNTERVISIANPAEDYQRIFRYPRPCSQIFSSNLADRRATGLEPFITHLSTIWRFNPIGHWRYNWI